ncbi:MAG: MBL fold metallo-hydrolase [Armatimonadota bacterium]
MGASSPLEVIVLRDNTAARQGVRAGHGFALLARVPGGSFLLDSGDSDETWANAEALGVELGEVSALVLSHGHYDHTNGLPGLLERVQGLRVIAHPAVFEPRFSTRGGDHFIGPPLSRAAVEAAGARLVLSAQAVEVLPGVLTTGEVPRTCGATQGGPHLMVERGGRLMVDDFVDDMSVIVDVGEAAVLLTGCAHAGLPNIVERAFQLAGRCPAAIIGGTHLAAAPEAEIARVAKGLHGRGVRTLVPMHCSGERGQELLGRHSAAETLTVGVGSVLRSDAHGAIEADVG